MGRHEQDKGATHFHKDRAHPLEPLCPPGAQQQSGHPRLTREGAEWRVTNDRVVRRSACYPCAMTQSKSGSDLSPAEGESLRPGDIVRTDAVRRRVVIERVGGALAGGAVAMVMGPSFARADDPPRAQRDRAPRRIIWGDNDAGGVSDAASRSPTADQGQCGDRERRVVGRTDGDRGPNSDRPNHGRRTTGGSTQRTDITDGDRGPNADSVGHGCGTPAADTDRGPSSDSARRIPARR